MGEKVAGSPQVADANKFPTPVIAEAAIRQYLEKKLRTRIPPAEMLTRGEDLFTAVCRRYSTARDEKAEPKKIYRMVARDFATAAMLRRQTTPSSRRACLEVGSEVAARLGPLLHDEWLAARFCDAFVVPNLDLADVVEWQPMSKRQLLPQMAATYREAKEYGSSVASWKLLHQWADAVNDQDWQDRSLILMGQDYEKLGDYESAMNGFNQIPNDSRLVGALTGLVSRVQKNSMNTLGKRNRPPAILVILATGALAAAWPCRASEPLTKIFSNQQNKSEPDVRGIARIQATARAGLAILKRK